MSVILQDYQKKISEIFSFGINILNMSRSLKSISSELQVLAYNGVVLSAKIHTNQGKSLITLSRFLSDLPAQIGPELKELEEKASVLANELTSGSLKIKKSLQYSFALEKIISCIFREKGINNYFDNIDYFNTYKVNEMLDSKIIRESSESQKTNMRKLIATNNILYDEISEHFFQVKVSFSKTLITAQRIKRNAFIADYMGSNILIESAYLETHQKNFQGFVEDIEKIISKLSKNLEIIEDRINFASQQLSKLNKF
jgi:hypothetical protein